VIGWLTVNVIKASNPFAELIIFLTEHILNHCCELLLHQFIRIVYLLGISKPEKGQKPSPLAWKTIQNDKYGTTNSFSSF